MDQPRPPSDDSATDRIIEQLREEIVSGRLEPGRAFSVRKLAGSLGVSAIPVREAVRHLQAEGLVDIQHARSPVVAPLSAEELHGVLRVRRLVEPELAARASVLVDRRAVLRLGEQLERHEDPDRPYLLHRALLEPAATVPELRLLTTLWVVSDRYQRIARRRTGSAGATHGHAIQSALIHAYRGADPVAARELMQQYVDETMEPARLAWGGRIGRWLDDCR